MPEIEPDDIGWACPECDLPFPTFEDVEEHKEDEHGYVRKYNA
jgi:hypothetical protein